MIKEIKQLDKIDISEIIKSANSEGHNFINRLVNEFQNGKNCFNKPGEKFTTYIINSKVVAVCGINIEPSNEAFRRIRRLYVLPEFRRKGIGSSLVKTLLKHASKHFSAVIVNIGKLPNEKFYSNLGFRKINGDYNYTHILKF